MRYLKETEQEAKKEKGEGIKANNLHLKWNKELSKALAKNFPI